MRRKSHIFKNLPQPLPDATQRLRLLLLRCYYRKTRWVNSTEDIENLLPWASGGDVTAVLRAMANGQWRPGGKQPGLLQRTLWRMKCRQRVFRHSAFIERTYESHTDKANRWAGSDGTGGLAGSAAEIERSRGEDPSGGRQLYRRL